MIKKVKMAGLAPPKKRSRHGVRYQMEVNFDDNESKIAFQDRLERLKQQLFPGKTPDNRQLLLSLLDRVESQLQTRSSTSFASASGSTSTCSGSNETQQEQPTVKSTSMLDLSGKLCKTV